MAIWLCRKVELNTLLSVLFDFLTPRPLSLKFSFLCWREAQISPIYPHRNSILNFSLVLGSKPPIPPRGTPFPTEGQLSERVET